MLPRLPIMLAVLYYSAVVAALLEPWNTLGKIAKIHKNDNIHIVDVPYHEEIIVISIGFFVIYDTEDADGGYLLKSTAQALVAKLRKEYVKIGIDFALDSFTQIHNSDWFHNAAPGTPAMERMMHVLRPIGPNFLHIFTVNFTSAKWHAYSSAVPWHYPSAPLFDGVLLHHSVVRQKKPEAISAVALWFGASHIYQNGCDDIFGDSVDDTPPQSGPVKGCPTAHKSCPGNHPSDLISNYMNGAGDSCMNSFTPGQIRRMQWMLSVYRGFNITIGTGVDPL